MNTIIKLSVWLELGFLMAALAYAVHGICCVGIISIGRAFFLFLTGNFIFPAQIRRLKPS